MMNIAEIDKVAANVAGQTIVGGSVGVQSEPMVDSDGREALRVTVVLPGHGDLALKQGNTLEFRSRLQHDLQVAGEERFAYVDFVTERELEEEDDHQS